MTNPLPLNAGQKAAAEAFFEFLLDPDQKGFIISGPAGVGKTFLMSYIIDNTMKHYQDSCKLLGMEPLYDSVHMTATTNKAAEVLGQSVGRETSTIHSFLGIRVQNDFNTGKTILKRIPNRFYIHEREVIFIDECSMIDSDLFRILMEATANTKIVFVGDHNQLPPIFEALSPIYRQGYQFFELTEQMRNSGSPALMQVCAQLRETVETGVFKPIHLAQGAITLLKDVNVQPTLMDAFVPGPNLECRILAYTNKTVNGFNTFIRNERQLPSAYTVGEVLVNNSSCKIREVQLSVEAEITVIEDNGTKSIRIGKDDMGDEIFLDVQILTLKTQFGGMVYDAPVPLDREHYDGLVKYYTRRKNWERVFHLKENYPDLRPRDAATVHKSQGSTYDSVFIDLDDISKVKQPAEAARMLYVAFSRAKHHVYLYGNLAQKYGGLAV